MERLVIDTETTGLSPSQNQVLTVGMLHIDVTKEFLKIMDSKHIFIRHNIYTIDPKALEINKIDLTEHDKTAISAKEACTEINQFVEENSLERTKLLGHNHQFDKSFITALFNKEKLFPKLHIEYSDTMYLWTHLKYKGYISPNLKNNLKTIAEFFKIDDKEAHNALGDCHITAKAYHEMLKIQK